MDVLEKSGLNCYSIRLKLALLFHCSITAKLNSSSDSDSVFRMDVEKKAEESSTVQGIGHLFGKVSGYPYVKKEWGKYE